MRIPEPFEWQSTYDDNLEYAVNNMEDDWECASNSVIALRIDNTNPAGKSILAPVMGSGSCNFAAHGTAADALVRGSYIVCAALADPLPEPGSKLSQGGSQNPALETNQNARFAGDPASTLDTVIAASNGLYNNTIPTFTHDSDYSEICFGNGAVDFDQHLGNESTEGGNCLPGQIGWIVEENERSALGWTEARIECLQLGMRLLA